MSQVRIYREDTVPSVNALTDRLEPPFLHTAHPNPIDCDRKDPNDPEKQNTRQRFLLDLALFWFPALVCVIRGTLSTRPVFVEDQGICFRLSDPGDHLGGSAGPPSRRPAFHDPVASCPGFRAFVFIPFSSPRLPTTLSTWCSILRSRATVIGCTSIISFVEWK